MGPEQAVRSSTSLFSLPEVRDPRPISELPHAFTPCFFFTDTHLTRTTRTLTVMAEPTMSSELRLEKSDNDYETWAALFKSSLRKKLLWGPIGDPAPDATNDPSGYAELVVKDQIAYPRFMLSVKLHHLPRVPACSSAKEEWDALEEMFKAQNNARRLQLAQELARL